MRCSVHGGREAFREHRRGSGPLTIDCAMANRTSKPRNCQGRWSVAMANSGQASSSCAITPASMTGRRPMRSDSASGQRHAEQQRHQPAGHHQVRLRCRQRVVLLREGHQVDEADVVSRAGRDADQSPSPPAWRAMLVAKATDQHPVRRGLLRLLHLPCDLRPSSTTRCRQRRPTWWQPAAS